MLHVNLDGPILTAVLDSPPANALGPAELQALHHLIEDLAESPGAARVLLLRGAERFFSGGVNVSMIAEVASSDGGFDQIAAFGSELQSVVGALEVLPIPTIAALRGSAVGGGFELALACDFRVVGMKSSFGLPESKLGLIPGGGGTQRLTRLAGRGTALRLIMLGELVKGDEAVRLGLAQWVCPNDDVDEFAVGLAHRLAELAPGALAAVKQCVTAAQVGDAGFDLEIALTKDLLAQPDTTDRLQSFLAGSR
jgi:enoyl-CoA hydratase/carnithine racemase